MSPRWLFFPSPASTASYKVGWSGTIGGGSGGNWYTNASNFTLSGTDNVPSNYYRYPHTDIRRQSSTQIRLLIGLYTSGDYANYTAWSTAVNTGGINVSGCTVNVDGTSYTVTNVYYNQYGPSVFYTMASSDITAIFNAMAAGVSYAFTFDFG